MSVKVNIGGRDRFVFVVLFFFNCRKGVEFLGRVGLRYGFGECRFNGLEGFKTFVLWIVVKIVVVVSNIKHTLLPSHKEL